jgi:MoxR-like ATPase
MLKSFPEERGKGSDSLDAAQEQINRLILGKQNTVRLGLCCILARGHLLIEDYPGVGKTTLAQAIARSLGLEFTRIQFTSDMLPADVIGVSVFDASKSAFRFHPGPVFSAVVLADEINRASPKAQSALLEAMEEQQVSVDGVTHELPRPFFVIATQNPHDQSGTFPLPESQLDRFTMNISIGYPERASEHALLMGDDRGAMLRNLAPVLDARRVIELQQRVDRVHAGEALAGYVLDILEASRTADWLPTGLSPRAGLSLIHCAKAWALLDSRDAALPEDVQAVATAVIGHRLVHNLSREEREQATARLMSEVDVD